MMNIQRYNELGTMKISWLDAHYHFSFSNYYNPERMGFGPLRVINDDIVKVGGGFDFHSHKDMEIITYVRKGAIAHRDNLGNEGKTWAGDVQVMSAGTGITHAEHNLEQEDTNLYQIWITPHTLGVAPYWETKSFDKTPVKNHLNLLVSGMQEHKNSDTLHINAQASIYGGVLEKGTRITHSLKGGAYILVSEGDMQVNGQKLSRGDGAEILNESEIRCVALSNAEMVLIDLPEMHHA